MTTMTKEQLLSYAIISRCHSINHSLIDTIIQAKPFFKRYHDDHAQSHTTIGQQYCSILTMASSGVGRIFARAVQMLDVRTTFAWRRNAHRGAKRRDRAKRAPRREAPSPREARNQGAKRRVKSGEGFGEGAR